MTILFLIATCKMNGGLGERFFFILLRSILLTSLISKIPTEMNMNTVSEYPRQNCLHAIKLSGTLD